MTCTAAKVRAGRTTDAVGPRQFVFAREPVTRRRLVGVCDTEVILSRRNVFQESESFHLRQRRRRKFPVRERTFAARTEFGLIWRSLPVFSASGGRQFLSAGRTFPDQPRRSTGC